MTTNDMAHTTYDTDQPWIVYHYGRTHDRWWPIWNSTRLLGRCCITTQCAVCGDVTNHWLKIPRIGPIPNPDQHAPQRVAYLQQHAHPDRGAPMSWKLPLLNPAAHPGGINLDAMAMRLEADLNAPNEE